MKEWKGKLEMWAHAYLPGAPHTNGLIESYHGVIKSLFFVTKCVLLFQRTLYPVCKCAMLTLPFDSQALARWQTRRLADLHAV